MKPGDSMLRRLQPLEDIGKLWDKKERFGTVNPKTIGLVLVRIQFVYLTQKKSYFSFLSHEMVYEMVGLTYS